MNSKGFTLVELLAMLVVLGILMAVTVPNISGILGQSKSNVLKEDVTKMVNTAKVKISSNKSISKPLDGKCLIFTLEYLNDSDDYRQGPNGGKYDFYDSFVIVKRVGSQYKYYVRLVEYSDGSKYGIKIAEFDSFEKDWDSKIGIISEDASLVGAVTFDEVATNDVIKKYCPSADAIQGFYIEA